MRPLIGWLVLAFSLSTSLVEATDFYVDPVAGSDTGDGSKARPWKTLHKVIASHLIESQKWAELPYKEGQVLKPVYVGAPIKAGDTILLASGFHGFLSINNMYNKTAITIKALPNAKPTFEYVDLRGVGNWKFEGLSVSLSYNPEYSKKLIFGVRSDRFWGPSHDIHVENCEVFSVKDISAWDVKTWNQKAGDGMESNGERIVFKNNTIYNIHHGIAIYGDHGEAIGNSIRNFSGDGLRGVGDYGLFENNYVANAYKVDNNHDDGFQSWSTDANGAVGKGEVKGIVIRGNTIINHEDPNQKLPAPLQGIGCFDGFFTDWVIENNVIIVNHFHGITLVGARNSKIINNTVFDPYEAKPGPAFIKIAPHKREGSGNGNIVRNNLSSDFQNVGTGITDDHNLKIKDPASFFVSVSGKWDLHLLKTAAAVNAGESESAPLVDKDGLSRPFGGSIDIGAYEWHDETGRPEDMGGESDMGMSEKDSGVNSNKPDPSNTNNTPNMQTPSLSNEREGLVDSEVGCGCSSTPTLRTHGEFLLFVVMGFAFRKRRTSLI